MENADEGFDDWNTCGLTRMMFWPWTPLMVTKCLESQSPTWTTTMTSGFEMVTDSFIKVFSIFLSDHKLQRISLQFYSFHHTWLFCEMQDFFLRRNRRKFAELVMLAVG